MILWAAMHLSLVVSKRCRITWGEKRPVRKGDFNLEQVGFFEVVIKLVDV